MSLLLVYFSKKTLTHSTYVKINRYLSDASSYSLSSSTFQIQSACYKSQPVENDFGRKNVLVKRKTFSYQYFIKRLIITLSLNKSRWLHDRNDAKISYGCELNFNNFWNKRYSAAYQDTLVQIQFLYEELKY